MPRNVDISQTDVDQLIIVDDKDVVVDHYTLAAGHVFNRGMALGMITASKKLIPSNSTATDGSNVIYAVAVEDVDTSATGKNADVDSPVYVEGVFNSKAMTFAGTDTFETHKINARKVGIYFQAAI